MTVNIADESTILEKGRFDLKEVTKEDPERYIIQLLDLACKSVWLSTYLAPEFYNRPSVKNAFLNAVLRTDEFRLLLDKSVNWANRKEALPWVADLYNKGQMVVKQSTKDIPHWLIIDNTHIRLEKEHKEDITKHSNLIVYYAGDQTDETLKRFVSTVENTFASWWNSSKIV